ncbi:hypothetical protein EH31_11130 [Erythrobacter longus]|uniref:TehB/YeaR-like domain-containing protein n=2 Tax=Erythrobacteraceae TaxID=335929 RepID=A0A074MCX6_ERYLO|nr:MULTISPECIES: DUF1971 domain-containing protein [Erythrobacteraceae]KEO89703.1 hypothetical protein EH31_11130 [Erythrobacter longus]MXO91038.1 DUF1971 domain-containing protein [Pontixanthobacter aquaemixtae]
MEKTLPSCVQKYAESPLFNEQTVPAKLTSNHDLKPGVWGKVCVVSGTLKYSLPAKSNDPQIIEAGGYAIIEPEQVHFVTPIGEVEFKVEFYR